MKKITTLIAAALITVTGSSAAADWSAARRIERLYVKSDGAVWLAVEGRPSGTCVNYDFEFRFSADDPGADGMLATLLAARANGQDVELWYEKSSVPGTNHGNGCREDRMAKLTGVGIR